jgi:DNA processing protein
MSIFSIEALLALFSIPTIGPAKMRKLISFFGSPEAVLDASVRELIMVEGIEKKTAEKIKNGVDDKFIKTQVEKIREHDAALISFWDEKYPEILKRIYDPPAFLFFKGNINVFESPALGIVGARTPSSYGKIITERFAEDLCRHGVTIVSGFARGVDTIAHKTVLKNGGKTIAVLGNGLDWIYPAENRSFINQIYEKGAIISEYAMGTKPDAVNFPKRNRIISGLSEGILVTEAGANSGSLITALYAVEQNREVFAIPGNITSGKSLGTNRIIKEGAKLTLSVNDILEELNFNLGEIKKTTSKKIPKLEGLSKNIYELLSGAPMHIDNIINKTNASPADTLTALLTLELMGIIKQLAGKMFVRI